MNQTNKPTVQAFDRLAELERERVVNLRLPPEWVIKADELLEIRSEKLYRAKYGTFAKCLCLVFQSDGHMN